jgi:hypothetical protein
VRAAITSGCLGWKVAKFTERDNSTWYE